jgi:hypothetical protein
MTAISEMRPMEFKLLDDTRGVLAIYPVAAATTIYSGGLVGMLATGYVQPLVNVAVATTLTGFDRFMGIAVEDADNSAGAAGAKNVKVLIDGCFYSAVSGLAITDVGTPVFATDSGALSKVSLGNPFVGWVEEYAASGYGWIRLAGPRTGHTTPIFSRWTPSIETAAANKALVIHATENQNGLFITKAFAIITEVMGGGTEDQGIITLEDTDGTDICTFTPTDGAADALNDYVAPSGGVYHPAVATGDLMVPVPAGKGVQCLVSQLTSGTSEAGAMKVYVQAVPCA